ncbi:hypothetical protein [Legionella waltersii]|uniref:Uncharacterized protein n=1 Tax=Legionella waltersii TaxID=66969 RepID=A0A0W1A4R2_9GAMM|nr:hypothetical protein [Legionella waltersii]KTD76314.1 hypothetical protein Lwal_2036 [Legionella waltersii]SNV13648.1 Uncharacterised protein [Legionella waltersii]
MRTIELLITREIKHNGLAVCLKPTNTFVLTPTLTHEIRTLQNRIAEQYLTNPWDGVLYVVWYLSANNQRAWRGLDFEFIVKCLIKNQEKHIEHYLQELFDLLYLNYISLGLPLLNCSIVNHKLMGISQEFFLLNQINFFKRHNPNSTNSIIEPLDFDKTFKKYAFPRFIYEHSRVYGFNSCNLNAMRDTLKHIHLNPLDESQLKSIKEIFDGIRDETQHGIYELAVKKLKVIKRMADIQVKNQVIYTPNQESSAA